MRRVSKRWHTSVAALFGLGAVACGAGTEHGEAMGAAGSAAIGGSAGQGTGGMAPVPDDDGDDVAVLGSSADCTFEIATTGAVVASYAPDLLGCSTFGEDLFATFVREDKLQASIRVAGFKEGETGKQLSASFQIGKLDFGGWGTGDTGCTVEITEQTLLGPAPPVFEKTVGRQYRIAGHGDCAEPAADFNSDGPAVIVGPFSFRVRQSFYD